MRRRSEYLGLASFDQSAAITLRDWLRQGAAEGHGAAELPWPVGLQRRQEQVGSLLLRPSRSLALPRSPPRSQGSPQHPRPRRLNSGDGHGRGSESSMYQLIKCTSVETVFALASAGSAAIASLTHASKALPMVFYRTVQVDGLSIFYREAGRPDAPTLLLLHGRPLCLL
jgi:hypothetical protein